MKILASLFRRTKPSAALSMENSADGYRAYTTVFDREVRAQDLDDVLGPLSPIDKAELDRAWSAFQGGLQSWRTGVHIHALDVSSELRSNITPETLADTVVTFLVDQSGSMRGQSMLLAAAAVDIAQDFLAHLGCSVEILGFTTSSWKGGESRKMWMRAGRPANPGRLCDLLHVIYSPAGRELSATMSWNLRPMLRADLPKENIDGEALLWAAGRLAKLRHKNKSIVVISDGASVDDSTLNENGGAYLERHLLQVISELEKDSSIMLSAVGIGHDVSKYYRRGKKVSTPADLGMQLIDVIKAVFKPEEQAPSDQLVG